MRSARGRARPCPQPGSVRCWQASPQPLQRCTSTPSSPPPRRRKYRDNDGRSHRAPRPRGRRASTRSWSTRRDAQRDPQPPRHQPSSGSTFRGRRCPAPTRTPCCRRPTEQRVPSTSGPWRSRRSAGRPTARVPDRPVHRRHHHPPKSGEVRQPDRRAADAGPQRSVRPGHSRAGDLRPRPPGRRAHRSRHRGWRAISPPRPWHTSARS